MPSATLFFNIFKYRVFYSFLTRYHSPTSLLIQRQHLTLPAIPQVDMLPVRAGCNVVGRVLQRELVFMAVAVRLKVVQSRLTHAEASLRFPCFQDDIPMQVSTLDRWGA